MAEGDKKGKESGDFEQFSCEMLEGEGGGFKHGDDACENFNYKFPSFFERALGWNGIN